MKPTFVLLRAALSCFVLWFSLSSVQAQMRVGQPAGSPDPSAALEVSGGPYANGSPYRGIAPPKVALSNTSQASPVDKPVVGLLVYNTAKAADVTPGYYYWEGNKWLRFTTNSTGSARVATVSGQYIPAYLISQVASLSSPDIIYIADDGKEGLFRYTPGSTTTVDNAMTLNASGGRYKRILDGWGISVKWFGAVGDGGTNDRVAIQAAIDWAKVATTGNTGQVRPNIIFPNGSYVIDGTLNVTDATGISLSGGNGRYLNTYLVGTGGGAIIDATGSSSITIQGFHFYTAQKDGTNNPATIGILLALGQNQAGTEASNGLTNIVKDCWFQMGNNPTANGGFGSTGIVNIRSEQCKYEGLTVRCETGLIFSHINNVTTRSANFTFTSAFTNIATIGSGSMGVVDVFGSSIENNDHVGHGIVLNGTNGINFSGYVHGGTGTQGSEDAAFGIYKKTSSIQLRGTVEGFSTLLYLGSSADATGLFNSTVKLSYANIYDITKPIIYMEPGTNIVTSDIGVAFGKDQSEIGSRYFLYTPPVNGGDSPTTAFIFQSTFSSFNWSNNSTFITPNLLKQTGGKCQFITNRPFETDERGTTFRFKYATPIGNIGENQPKDVMRMTLADKATTTSGNAGVYNVKIAGVIKSSSYTETDGIAADFVTTILIYQKANGTRVLGPTTTIINSKVATNPSYADISNITADLFFGGLINLRITPTTSGTATNHGLVFEGTITVLSDFAVNSSIIFP